MSTPAKLAEFCRKLDDGLGNTCGDDPPRDERLHVVSCTQEPDAQWKPNVPRSCSEIDKYGAGLRPVLNSLVTGERPWPLYLWGGEGRGKSCAALVVADHVRGSYHNTLHSFGKEINDAWFERAFSESGHRIFPEQVWERWVKAPLAVMDDLGLEPEASKAGYLLLYDLLEKRGTRPTIYVSNFEPDGLNRIYDLRIVSRLKQGTVSRMTGPDRRTIHAKGR